MFNAFGAKPQGFTEITDLSSAVGLGTIPTGAAGASGYALIQAETENVRWRDDGDDPTASVGILIEVGVPYLYQGDLSAIRLIEVQASAKVNVSFYSATGGILQP